MKFSVRYLLYSFIVSLYCFLCPHKSQAQAYKTNYITIAGRIAGTTTKDTVKMVLKKDFIYLNVGAETFSTACNKDGKFSFTFNSTHIAMISLYLNNKDPFISYRYVEPGDSIYCAVTAARFVSAFSGKGVAKFYCMQAIKKKRNKINKKSFSKIPAGLFAEDSVINELTGAFQQVHATAHELLNIAEGYKDRLSAGMLKLLKADILGESGRDKCFLISYYLKNADSVRRRAIQKLFLRNVPPAQDSLDEIAVYSDNYIEFLYRVCQVQLTLKNKETYSLNALYDLIASRYSGLIRNRVLTSFLLRPHSGASNRDYERCLLKAIKDFNSEPYKSWLQKQYEMTSQGAVAFNFNLPDVNGKYVSLNDLRGKVVFVDFWFTGCSACKKLAVSLEEKVIPAFNNSKVVFVSICLDEDKSRWLNSLKAGGYSSPAAINLFTEGLAFNHPLAKRYNIQGCPFVLIIDKEGRIIEINPSREPVDIINELHKAVHQKNTRLSADSQVLVHANCPVIQAAKHGFQK